jgi:hypothetical protein
MPNMNQVAQIQGKKLAAIMTNTAMIQTYIYVLLVLIVVGILIYITNRASARSRNCNRLDKVYKDFPPLSSVSPLRDQRFTQSLRNYYIKSAYNCCATGAYKNTWVDVCALKNVIKQGCRCLDFEIYSVKGKPAVAVSSKNDIDIKESYNSLDIGTVFSTINKVAFSQATCPNSRDPLLLNFRVKSNHKDIYDQIGTLLYQYLSTKMLDPSYSYGDHSENFGKVKLTELMNKVIIMVDAPLANYEGTKLEEYVNLRGGSTGDGIFLREFRNFDVEFTGDPNGLIQDNKYSMAISMPDLGASCIAMPAILHFKYGIQMIAMCFQTESDQLTNYNEIFNQRGHAFVLKPPSLCGQPIIIEPKTPNPDVVAMNTKKEPWLASRPDLAF